MKRKPSRQLLRIAREASKKVQYARQLLLSSKRMQDSKKKGGGGLKDVLEYYLLHDSSMNVSILPHKYIMTLKIHGNSFFHTLYYIGCTKL